MFYLLLFAHLLTDYPLQSNWMVSNRGRPAVRLLHVFSHFLVSLVFTLFYVPTAWPFLILLAGIHFLIDSGKYFVSQTRPNLVIFPYLFDQVLHLLSIILISVLIAGYTSVPPFAIHPVWLILSIAYLVVTYVTYISEKTLTSQNKAYYQQVIDKKWSRMVARAIFLTIPIILWLFTPTLLSTSTLVFPYKLHNFGPRALITDIIIAGSGAVFILIVV
ncbi:MAG: DUF3307 domain-containing protein [Anaerolineales bacterium]